VIGRVAISDLALSDEMTKLDVPDVLRYSGPTAEEDVGWSDIGRGNDFLRLNIGARVAGGGR
jgi:hypothetical protein